jgi:glycoprotein-N-acetylgalactosamine 3-beta-galactosyltransferase
MNKEKHGVKFIRVYLDKALKHILWLLLVIPLAAIGLFLFWLAFNKSLKSLYYKNAFDKQLLEDIIGQNRSDSQKLSCDEYRRQNEPKILCAIFTVKESHRTKMKAVHDTWSKRCDIRLYMTGPKAPDQQDNADMPFVYLNITDTLRTLTYKHTGTIVHVYDFYLFDFDWFLYANDDTYIVMENLKLFVKDKCPSEASIYGKVMKHQPVEMPSLTNGDNSRGFIQGGSGWLSSHEAIRRFGEAMKRDARFCICRDGRREDQEISDCYRRVDVYPGESRDNENRERFIMDSFAK